MNKSILEDAEEASFSLNGMLAGFDENTSAYAHMPTKNPKSHFCFALNIKMTEEEVMPALKDASVNVQRRQKTYEGFERLPDEFTSDDVMRCFNLSTEGAARMKIKRLQSDHLIEKLGDGRQAGVSKSSYRKTGNLML